MLNRRRSVFPGGCAGASTSVLAAKKMASANEALQVRSNHFPLLITDAGVQLKKRLSPALYTASTIAILANRFRTAPRVASKARSTSAPVNIQFRHSEAWRMARLSSPGRPTQKEDA